MLRRLIIRLTASCVLLASVGVTAEIEPPDAHSVSADQVVEASALIDPDGQADSNGLQHDDHCCHGHVMADPGTAHISGAIALKSPKRYVSVSADSLVFRPPVRPPKHPSAQLLA